MPGKFLDTLAGFDIPQSHFKILGAGNQEFFVKGVGWNPVDA